MSERIPCGTCGNTFKTKDSLRAHKHYAHKNIETKTSLDLHVYPKIEENAVLDDYLEDNNNRYNEKDFRDFKTKMKVPKNKHKAKPYSKPEQLDEPSESNIAGPSSGKPIKTYKCHICDDLLQSEQDREEHIERSHPACKLCLDRFPNQTAFEKHITEFHSPTVKCPICNLVLADLNLLLQHVKIHPECTVCGSRFTNLRKLSRHEKQHVDQHRSKRRRIYNTKSLVCGICERKDFKDKVALIKHRHQNHSYHCSNCLLSFVRKEELEIHSSLHPIVDDDSRETVNPYDIILPDVVETVKPESIDGDSSDWSNISKKSYSKGKKLIDVHIDRRRKHQGQLSDNESSITNYDDINPDVKEDQNSFSARENTDDSDQSIQSLDDNPNLISDIETTDDNDHRIQPFNADVNSLSDHESVDDKDRRIQPFNANVNSLSDRESTDDNDQRIQPFDSDVNPLSDRESTDDNDQRIQPFDIKKDTGRNHRDSVSDDIKDEIGDSTLDSVNGDIVIKSRKIETCKICLRKFLSRRKLRNHLKMHIKKNIRKRGGGIFICKNCQKSFKSRTTLMDHISIVHPRCPVCNTSFKTSTKYLIHLRNNHVEKDFEIEESDTSIDSGDELENNDKEFQVHINCVTIERFLEIRKLIMNNDFRTLSSKKSLLHSLSILMKGVKRGFIPICSTQRLVMTNSMKELLYKLARNPSSNLVMANKQILAHLFEVLWSSIKYISDSFNQYH